MPPRFAFWTILIDNAPTAFRARDRDDLLPTLAQLRRTNQDVVLKWFGRGRLWDSPEAAQQAAERNERSEKRGSNWRPGGAHQDPRDRFKKKKEWRAKPDGGPKRTGSGKAAGNWPTGGAQQDPRDRFKKKTEWRAKPDGGPKRTGFGKTAGNWPTGGTNQDPRDRFKKKKEWRAEPEGGAKRTGVHKTGVHKTDAHKTDAQQDRRSTRSRGPRDRKQSGWRRK
jgi:hypothetical protein